MASPSRRWPRAEPLVGCAGLQIKQVYRPNAIGYPAYLSIIKRTAPESITVITFLQESDLKQEWVISDPFYVIRTHF